MIKIARKMINLFWKGGHSLSRFITWVTDEISWYSHRFVDKFDKEK